MSTPIRVDGSRHLGPAGLFTPGADPASFGLAPAPRGAVDEGERARTAASQLVATTFIKPILSRAREMNRAPAPFGPTQAEKQFGAMLDNKIADDIARSMGLAITERIERDISRRAPEPGARTPNTVDLIG